MHENVIPRDAEVVLKLTDTEDQFVERKTAKDKGAWLRTVVAFANSTPIGVSCHTLYRRRRQARDHGPSKRGGDLESYSDVIAESVWPPVYSYPKTLSHRGRVCLAVIIPGSAERPHFAGKSYVRQGAQTKEASEMQFDELVSQRNSKAREVLKWISKQVTLTMLYSDGRGYKLQTATQPIYIETYGPHFLTIRMENTMAATCR
jgi:hypothetical protein